MRSAKFIIALLEEEEEEREDEEEDEDEEAKVEEDDAKQGRGTTDGVPSTPHELSSSLPPPRPPALPSLRVWGWRRTPEVPAWPEETRTC
ncbi:hypothetical protein E2C01_008562 [Portunus trituberculatus]|uniref:Uncharacterized protein n=1 Tax=Portunus trituberculatus TaxID=210409 RepID=A0A5B7D2A9_PORTR|nr:hypothetical protein [Portunus trituberculatus]